jgi:hypothetical protein
MSTTTASPVGGRQGRGYACGGRFGGPRSPISGSGSGKLRKGWVRSVAGHARGGSKLEVGALEVARAQGLGEKVGEGCGGGCFSRGSGNS